MRIAACEEQKCSAAGGVFAGTDLLAYRRYGAPDGEELLVLCNLTGHEVPVTLPEGWAGTEKLLGNYTETAAALRPYECTVLKR